MQPIMTGGEASEMGEHATDVQVLRYLRGCAWPCPPDVARAIAADNDAPLSLLLMLEAVPDRLYFSDADLLRALPWASLLPAAAHIGGGAGLCVREQFGRSNGLI
jgi:hypothetical protein